MSAWIAPSEALPDPGVHVLARFNNALGKRRTIIAQYVRAHEYEADGDEELELDEHNDVLYWPEGWYECIECWDDLSAIKVSEEVIEWRSIPT